MVRRLAALPILVAFALTNGAPANADSEPDDGSTFPRSIALPAGFQPEGIAIAPIEALAYFGSRVEGSIYRVNLRTGEGSILTVGPGTGSNGLKIDPFQRLFVAGAAAGNARIIDLRTGAILQSYQLATTANTFVNDLILAWGAAWFTDSSTPVLYKIPLFGRDGGLPTQDDVERLPLSGDIVFGPGVNSNGITTTPDERSLLVVQSNTGGLFRVDPATGVARAVDLGGELLPGGDGLLREGHTLFAVQNRSNLVAKIELDDQGATGTVIERVTDPLLDVPATVAAFGNRLYMPNARFTTAPTPTTPYDAIAIDKP